MISAFNALFNYLKPILKYAMGLTAPIAFVLGVINDPEGAINTFLIKGIDLIAVVFPSTPEELKIASIINGLGDQLPLVGKSVIYEILQTLAVIFGLTLAVKIYKLIPFKAT